MRAVVHAYSFVTVCLERRKTYVIGVKGIAKLCKLMIKYAITHIRYHLPFK